jgi:hypothetical protein
MKSGRICFALALCLFIVSAQAHGQEVPRDLHTFLEMLQSEQTAPLQVQRPREIEKTSSYVCQSQCPDSTLISCFSSSEETCETGECWVVCDSWHFNCPGYRGITCEIYDEG